MSVDTEQNAVTIEMTKTKETKNTFAFTADDESAPIPTVYVRKDAFDGEPTKITLTLEA